MGQDHSRAQSLCNATRDSVDNEFTPWETSAGCTLVGGKDITRSASRPLEHPGDLALARLATSGPNVSPEDAPPIPSDTLTRESFALLLELDEATTNKSSPTSEWDVSTNDSNRSPPDHENLADGSTCGSEQSSERSVWGFMKDATHVKQPPHSHDVGMSEAIYGYGWPPPPPSETVAPSEWPSDIVSLPSEISTGDFSVLSQDGHFPGDIVRRTPLPGHPGTGALPGRHRSADNGHFIASVGPSAVQGVEWGVWDDSDDDSFDIVSV